MFIQYAKHVHLIPTFSKFQPITTSTQSPKPLLNSICSEVQILSSKASKLDMSEALDIIYPETISIHLWTSETQETSYLLPKDDGIGIKVIFSFKEGGNGRKNGVTSSRQFWNSGWQALLGFSAWKKILFDLRLCPCRHMDSLGIILPFFMKSSTCL